uniref:Sushi domain-containing protein n=1 Tax=Ascaris lumbricoides TaxID=6252 RepID=A0A0M3IVS8_ASCLU
MLTSLGVTSIGCFVCSSFNGSNPLCEDTFNSTIHQGTLLTLSGTYYQYPCWAFKKQRQGLFPADHCIKVNGYRSVTSIGCFVCSSFNGSNPLCEDTFNSTIHQGTLLTLSGTYYQYPCWAFKKQRQGLFPADHCIKVNGYRSKFVVLFFILYNDIFFSFFSLLP